MKEKIWMVYNGAKSPLVGSEKYIAYTTSKRRAMSAFIKELESISFLDATDGALLVELYEALERDGGRVRLGPVVIGWEWK